MLTREIAMSIKHKTLLASALLAMAPAIAASLELAGFQLGEPLDVSNPAIRSAYGLSEPATVTLSQTGYRYLQCERDAATNGFDVVSISLSLDDKHIMSVWAVQNCNDSDEAIAKHAALTNSLLSAYADRATADGDKILEVYCGDTYVQAEIAEQSYKNEIKKNNERACGSGGLKGKEANNGN